MFLISKGLLVLSLLTIYFHQSESATTLPPPPSKECNEAMVQLYGIFDLITMPTKHSSKLAPRLQNALKLLNEFIPKLTLLLSPILKPQSELKPEDYGCTAMFNADFSKLMDQIFIRNRVFEWFLSVPGKWDNYKFEVVNPLSIIFFALQGMDEEPIAKIEAVKKACRNPNNPDKDIIKSFSKYVDCSSVTDDELGIDLLSTSLLNYISDYSLLKKMTKDEVKTFVFGRSNVIDKFHLFKLDEARKVEKEIRDDIDKQAAPFESDADAMDYLNEMIDKKKEDEGVTCVTKIAMARNSWRYETVQNVMGLYFNDGVQVVLAKWICSTIDNNGNTAKIGQDLKVIVEEVVAQITKLRTQLIASMKNYGQLLIIDKMRPQ